MVDKPKFEYQHPMVRQMFNALSTSTTTPSSIFACWGVYEFGKSTAAKQLAWRLQQDAARTVVYLHAYDFAHKNTMRERLQFHLGLTHETSRAELFSTFFSKPTTIIMDHFDIMMHDRRVTDTMQFLSALNIEAQSTQRFNVLLLLNSWERASELQAQGYSSRYTVLESGKWSEEQLDKIFNTLPSALQTNVDNRENVIRFAAISGTPGDFVAAVHGEKVSLRRAAMLDTEWRKGTKALCSTTKSDCLETEKGMFPDKTGIYHWEEVVKIKVENQDFSPFLQVVE
jgi:hypothetical protein